MAFDRGADRMAIDPSSVAAVARAVTICKKSRGCPDRAGKAAGSCEGCRRQAVLELDAERRLSRRVHTRKGSR